MAKGLCSRLLGASEDALARCCWAAPVSPKGWRSAAERAELALAAGLLLLLACSCSE